MGWNLYVFFLSLPSATLSLIIKFETNLIIKTINFHFFVFYISSIHVDSIHKTEKKNPTSDTSTR